MRAVEKVERLVKDATDQDAEPVLGGKKTDGEMDTFYPEAILKDMNAKMQASNQLFGPVVSFYKFKTESEVLKLANNGGCWAGKLCIYR